MQGQLRGPGLDIDGILLRPCRGHRGEVVDVVEDEVGLGQRSTDTLEHRHERVGDIDIGTVGADGPLGVAILVEMEAVEAERLGGLAEIGSEVGEPVGCRRIEDEQEIAERIGLAIRLEQRLVLPAVPFLRADRIDRRVADSA